MSEHEVRSYNDILRLDRKEVDLFGYYQVIPRPVHGDAVGPEDYAVVVLQDNTEVYLESFGTSQAIRDKGERDKYNGYLVRVVGEIYRRMPTKGQGPLAPSICDIRLIELMNDEKK